MFTLSPLAMMMFVISILLVGLGFIALLLQKVYIDEGGQATETELPLIGKLKTNYPALIFVAAGAVLAGFTYQKETAHLEQLATNYKDWTIEGVFVDKENPLTNDEKERLRVGKLFFHPSTFGSPIAIDGDTFRVTYKVPDGKNFEDEVKDIQYMDGPDFTGTIFPLEATMLKKHEYYRQYEFKIERREK